jgi:ubiquinone/menaquinone biosynthesis C-methylase UbiE
MIFKHADLKHKEVLEIGCGDGRITSFLKGEAHTLIAIDSDAQSIKKASSKLSGVEFRVGCGESLDFPDNRFDLILFTLSLHHQNSRMASKKHRECSRIRGKFLENFLSTFCFF